MNPTELELPPDKSNAQLATTGGGTSEALFHLIEKMIGGGVTESNVVALDKLLGVFERLDEKRAERQFAAAFVALQSEMPAIYTDKAVPGNDGSTRYRFATYESIMEAVKPLLQKHGFTVTFSMAYADGRVIQTCVLQHIGGHTRSNQFAVRIGSGPPKSSEAQGDGAASTYAKRFALCNALNIVIENDTDGKFDVKAEGDVISRDKAQYVHELLKETNSDPVRFLAMAGVDKVEDIRAGNYDLLVRMLLTKVKK